MNQKIIIGAGLGAALGFIGAVSVSLARTNELFWAVMFALLGGAMGATGWWILRQSGDVKKMSTALPLSGAVVASLICVVTGERFIPPVVGAFVLGLLVAPFVSRGSA